MLKLLKNLFSKPYCDIDLNDGFRITTEKNKDGSINGIYIKKDSEIIFNLFDLLPSYGNPISVFFGDKFYFGCSRDLKEMEIVLEKMKTKEDIVSLLHEIGHARDIEFTEISLYAEKKYFEASYRDPLNQFPPERVLAFYEDFKIKLECEQRAWDYAWEVILFIKDRFGIEIINKNEFERIKKRSLETYTSFYINVAWGYISSSIKTKKDFEYHVAVLACRA